MGVATKRGSLCSQFAYVAGAPHARLGFTTHIIYLCCQEITNQLDKETLNIVDFTI